MCLAQVKKNDFADNSGSSLIYRILLNEWTFLQRSKNPSYLLRRADKKNWNLFAIITSKFLDFLEKLCKKKTLFN